jgi:hypothetical protein
MFWSAFAEIPTSLAQSALVSLGLFWAAFWPARHALLTVVLILMYVHRLEPSSDEDPFTF